MADDVKKPTVIKKYANRRLYHTGTSTYVTLEDLAGMIRTGEEFEVQDAKSGDDITRSVLTQIIFEQESKGTNLLPIPFLRQLIGFYGDSLQGVVPTYLESAMHHFTRDQVKFREQFAKGFTPVTALSAIEEQTRRNMKVFQEAMRMFLPFGQAGNGGGEGDMAEGAPAAPPAKSNELDALKEQMADMQKKIEAMAKK
ncbi:MAG: polyhydroxyalkanoate synthesis repressor PhaR [Beijerinckiaceae bacterium]